MLQLRLLIVLLTSSLYSIGVVHDCFVLIDCFTVEALLFCL